MRVFLQGCVQKQRFLTRQKPNELTVSLPDARVIPKMNHPWRGEQLTDSFKFGGL